MPYELELPLYKGPIEKLLELVEERKLKITTLSLAQVTGDFLRYIENLQREILSTNSESGTNKRIRETRFFADAENDTGEDLKGIIADFLVVASRLLLIKSRELLPALEIEDEEEMEIRDLEARLRLYQELKGTKAHILELWHEAPLMVSREYMSRREPIFLPPSGIRREDLLSAVRKIAGELERFLKPVGKIEGEVVHLKEKIEEILERISKGVFSFHSAGGERTKKELVILFLAVLHLVRDYGVEANQNEAFGHIVVERRDK